MSDLKSKGGATIEKGDTVYTKIRGGRHEGEVCFHWPLIIHNVASGPVAMSRLTFNR